MSFENDGGSAFPLPLGSCGRAEPNESGGMSMRDYFAAKAMASILAGSNAPAERYGEMLSTVSRLAYLAADAMLAAREVDQ